MVERWQGKVPAKQPFSSTDMKSLVSIRRALIPIFSKREKEQDKRTSQEMRACIRSRKSRPVWACDGRQKRDQGGALFEAMAEFARTPAFAGHHRSPEAKRKAQDSRVAFSLPTCLFGEAKAK